MNKPTILCVDDEPNVLLTLRTQLIRSFPHYAVEIAESGDEALGLIEELLAAGIDIPLVIADQIMPGMKGNTFLIELHHLHPNILKVMLTGQASAEDVGNAVNQGNLYRFIAKPWSEADLILTVTEALRRHQQEQQLAEQQVALERANRQLEVLNARLEGQVQERTQQLRLNESQLRAFIEHTPVGVAMFDRHMNYLIASQRWITDYNLEDQSSILGKCHYDVFPGFRDAWRVTHERVLLGFVERSEKDFYIRPDGTQEWLRWEVRPWYDDAGVIGGIIIFGEVITDRIRTELALQESEERYRLLSEVSPVGIFRTNLQGQCIYANTKTLEITGLTLEDNLGDGWGWGYNLHPADRDWMYAAWANFVEQVNLGQDKAEYKVEHRFLYPDGSLKWCLGQAVPERNATGEVVGFIGSVMDITDRKQAEIALQRSEEKQRALIAALPDLIMRVSGDGIYLDFVATSSFRVIGKTGDFIGTHVTDSLPPELAKKRMDAIRAALDTGNLQIYEQEVSVDGSLQIEECRVVVCSPNEVLIIGRDISDRKQAEIALRNSERRYATLAENSPVGVFQTDAQGNCLYVNPTWCQIPGIKPEDVLGSHWFKAIHPDDREHVTRAWSAYTANQQIAFAVECRFQQPTGQVKWVFAQASPITDDTGVTAGYIGTITDIDLRKQTEADLRKSERRYATLAEVSPVGIFRLDTTGACVYVNHRWCEMTGRSAESALGTNWLQILHPEDRDRILAEWQQAYQHSGFYRGEGRYQQPDGSIAWFYSQMVPETDTNGDVTGFVGTVTDISDRKQSELAMQSLLQGTASVTGEAFFPVLAQQISTALQASYVFVAIQAGEELHTIGLCIDGQIQPNIVYALPHTPCERTMEQEFLICKEQVQQAFPFALSLSALEAESYVGVALKNRQGQSIGILSVVSRQPLQNENYTQNILRIFAARASAELERLQAQQALQNLTQILEQRVERRTQALQEQTTLLQTILNSMGDSVLVANTQGEIILHNPAAEHLTGLGDLPTSIETLQVFWGIDLPDGTPCPPDQQILSRAIKGESIDQVEVILRNTLNPSGTYVEATVRPLLDQEDSLIGGVVVIRDISDRKRAESALRQSEKKYRAIFDNSQVGIFRSRIEDGLILEANQRFVELAGFQTIDEVVGKRKTTEFYDVKVRQWVREQLYQFGVLNNFEFEYQEARGKAGWGLVSLSLNRDEQCIEGVINDISDLKKAESQLRESQQFTQSITENTPNIIYIYALDEHRNIYCNREIFGILGYSTEDIQAMGRNVLSFLVHPDDWSRVLQYQQQIASAQDQEIIEQEYRMRHADGSWRYLSDRVTVFKRDVDGRVLQYIGAALDVTDRKLAEQKLQAERLRLELALDAAQMGTWESNMETGYWSERTEAIFGYAPGTFPGDRDSFLKLVYPADQERVFQALTHSFATQAPYNLEYRINRQDGALRWVAVSGKVVPNQEGTGLRIVGIALDVTDRKQAEEAIRISEEQLQLALEGSGDGLWDWNIVTGEAYFNPRWLGILGYELGELPGHINTWERLLHPEDQPQVMDILNAHMQDSSIPYQTEYRALAKTGEWRWIANYGKVVARDAAGKPLRMVGLLRDISDRKQVEETLRQSELKYRSIFDNSQVGIFCSQIEQGLVLEANQYFANLLGYEYVDQIVGKIRIVDYFSRGDWQVILDELRQCGVINNFEFQFHTQQGAKGWGMVSAKLNADPQQIEGVIVNIGDRKRAEANLRDSEERLRLALTAANQGLYDLNLQTGEAIVSPEYATMLGYDPAEFHETNAKWIQRLHPDDLERTASLYQAYVNGEIADYKVEFRQRTQQGQWKWILSLGKIVSWDETGQPLRLLGTHTDISDRKQAEIALQESQQFLQTVIDTLPLIVFWKDCQSVYLGCNVQSARAAGLASPADIIGKTDYDLPWAETEAHAYRVDDQHVIRSGEAKLGIIETQLRADGSKRWIETNKLPLYNLAGEVIGLLGTYEDITDRKAAEAALLQAKLELEDRVEQRTAELRLAKETAEAANRAKSIFLANMSHELRTPLNAILGFSQLLNRNAALHDEEKKQVSIVNRSGEHLLNLINDILEMSKIEAGRVVLNPKNFDLYQLLHSLQEMFSLKASSKGLQLTFEMDASVPQYIQTDESKLRQVIINLVSNAIKFTSHGSVTLSVYGQPINSPAQNPQLESDPAVHQSSQLLLDFAVTDTGSGIDPNEQESLFEPFVQTKLGQKAPEGTGLGLPISRQFIQLMGGELTVYSVLGQGATFRFQIPVETVRSTELLTYPPSRQVIGLAPNQDTYRLLVVEDNWENRQFLIHLLESIGCDVRSAENGQEAVTLWQEWSPHLIWMDMRMPVMDGYEATQQIRSLSSPAATQPKILAITASAFEDERAAILAAGCDDLVCKPVTANILFEKMAAHLGIQYLYQDQLEFLTTTQTGNLPSSAIATALEEMPLEWLEQLHRAARIADEELIFHLLDQIPPDQTTLATSLKALVHEFCFDRVIKLAHGILQKTKFQPRGQTET